MSETFESEKSKSKSAKRRDSKKRAANKGKLLEATISQVRSNLHNKLFSNDDLTYSTEAIAKLQIASMECEDKIHDLQEVLNKKKELN